MEVIMNLLGIGINSWELWIILAIALLLFGSRLPSLARNFGKSITEFKKGVKDVKDDVASTTDEPKKLEEGDKKEIPAEKIEKSDSQEAKSEEKVS